MTVVGLDHVQVAIPRGSEDEARSFYAGRLGLLELDKPEPLRSRGGCWFACGSTQLHLGVEDSFRPARKAHPAFHVTALKAFVEERHLEVRWDDELAGTIRCFVDDPFGNRIELVDVG